MSTHKVVATLNRLLANHRFSMVNYVCQTSSWTHPGNEALSEAIRGIADDHEHYSRRLSELIAERDGSVEPGSFPMAFMSLNDLSLDYLLTRIIADQRQDIQEIEKFVADLTEDAQARDLASEILGSERAHVDILNEFLPQTNSVPNGDQNCLQVA